MGIGPALAVPKALALAGLSVDDIGLFEVNEAFASQSLYVKDALGIPDEKLPSGIPLTPLTTLCAMMPVHTQSTVSPTSIVKLLGENVSPSDNVTV